MLLPRLWTQRLPDLLPSPKIKPTAQKHHHEIEDAIGPKHTVVFPFVGIVDIETGSKFITVRILAELANTVATGLNVATC